MRYIIIMGIEQLIFHVSCAQSAEDAICQFEAYIAEHNETCDPYEDVQIEEPILAIPIQSDHPVSRVL